jgi:ABC-type xylose transport system substrate-binding protein
MPLTRITAPRHLGSERIFALASAAQEGLVETCKVPGDDLFQVVQRVEAEDLIMHPTFGGVNRSADACIIEIIFLTGRSDDQKRELFRYIAAKAVAAGMRADDIMVALSENSLMDWSIGQGIAYADQVASKHKA